MRYYMRSFSMTVKQLREIFAFMISNSLGYRKLLVLFDKTSPFRDDDMLFLRIGKTRRDPFQRHQEDIRRGGPSNFVYAFMLTADRLFPAIADSCTIFELEQFPEEPDLANDALKATQTLPSISNEQTNILELEDLCEQFLMALFGLDFVLNTTVNCAWSANGSAHDTALSDDHYLKFQTLNTKVFPLLRREHFQNASIETAEKVSGWAKAIQSYAAVHQRSVSTYRNKTYDFLDQLREMVAEQAMPATFGEDMNLLLLVGGGIPPVAYQHAQNLWTHPSPFANMLKTLFSRLQEWELPITTPQNCQTPIDLSIFPFVDFCPCSMGEGMDDTFPDNPERRSFSDHGVKRLEVKYDGDSGSPGTSTKITPLSGLAAGPLDLTGGKLKPLIQLAKGASHQESETASLNQDATVSHNPPFDNQAETSVLKCRAMSDITTNMTMKKSPQFPQASPVSTLNGFQESTTHETVVIKTRHYKPKLHGSEVRRGGNGMLGIYWLDSFKARHAFSIWAPQAVKGSERAYYLFFSLDGIDVRNEEGESYAKQPHRTVTLGLERIPHSQRTHELGLQFIKLWEHETGQDFQAAIENQASHWRPQRFEASRYRPTQRSRENERPQPREQVWEGPGKPLPKEANQYDLDTIAFEDTLRILSECLDYCWPQGGELFICDPIRWPEKTEVNIWSQLRR
ncbi:hypothetical protein LTR47_010288 [Exophiala xenobiotica]|nr:hypothetical protein LTR92_009956 [Exophiala xenobiotica]KAK5223322.1 hypothetical protein LTR47_010288 [Exophiala xenobiotica]KAK5248618.1 hypothetical protein LTS06_006436 [Exophiala xenobiotica]KAK5286321.1 hypothetical protein LTR14_010280 [Exophiala xenobiotica]KAK5345520.1 hypothetical protein LTR61_010781 [Exophiala xenobiotica]